MLECDATAREKCVSLARLSRRFTKGPELQGCVAVSAAVPKTDTGQGIGEYPGARRQMADS